MKRVLGTADPFLLCLAVSDTYGMQQREILTSSHVALFNLVKPFTLFV